MAAVTGSLGARHSRAFPAQAGAALAVLALLVAGLWGGHDTSPGATGAPAKPSLSFVENAGQVDARVRYLAQGPGYGFYFTKQEAVLSFDDGKRGTALALGFEDASPDATLSAGAELPGKVSYMRGSDPAGWQTGLRSYGEVRYANLWPGIDLVVRGSGSRLKYEFHVRPGARVGDIGLRYRGAERLALGTQGALLVHTPRGVLRDAAPVSYQTIGGRRVPVASDYRLGGGKHSYGFAIGAGYDPGQPLVIDPGIDFSTFLGGGDTDAGFDLAVDSGGNTYVTGYTYSSDFPTSPGAYDTTRSDADVIVTKLDAAGGLVWSTLLGGSSSEFGEAIAVDGAGAAHIAGETNSGDFPVTPGAHDTTPDGPFQPDAFVTKVNPTGTGLAYSTYLGGQSMETAFDIVLDGTGRAHVTGSTGSSGSTFNDFPTTSGAYDTSYNGSGDVYATRLDPTGSTVTYSTFVGGSTGEGAHGIALDQSGSIYLTGGTNSSDFPATPGAFDTTATGGFNEEAFVTKLDSTGASLAYSTYLGGSSTELPRTIAVDADGSAYVTGMTFSADFPTTAGAYDTTNAGNFDTYVTKLNASGSALDYSTFLGGANSDSAGDIEVDADGSAHVAGYTNSADFPITSGAHDTTFAGSDEVFVTKFDPSGSSLAHSTFLGGSGSDIGNALELGADGAVYVTGLTDSPDFPTTPGAHDATYNGGVFDAFATKLDLTGPPPSTFGCTTRDQGTIVAQNGDRTRFSGRAQVSESGEPSGLETYTDRGPSDRITMRSTSIDAIVCDGRDASIFGRALVNGDEDTFQIDLHDGGGRKKDTYRIRLGSGYDSGEQNLRSGQVKVR